jgi:triphosphoribosyl-dephospho-CoA synthase
MRSPAQNAQLALLVEVTGTPKPGNVDRAREFPDLRFEHFLAGAVGAWDGLQAAEEGASVGAAFEHAVAGMSEQSGGNTQFGALLLLVPLVRTTAEGDLVPGAAARVVENTTVEDAADFYRAFEHVDVFVGDPPEDLPDLDVRRGSDAIPAVEERGLTLFDVMERSADGDEVAREWTGGFERTFRAADRIADLGGPVPDRAARAYLELLARGRDAFVEKRHGRKVAESVRTRAQAALDDDREHLEAFANSLVEDGINPGTTADITAGGLFVALERGLSV